MNDILTVIFRQIRDFDSYVNFRRCSKDIHAASYIYLHTIPYRVIRTLLKENTFNKFVSSIKNIGDMDFTYINDDKLTGAHALGNCHTLDLRRTYVTDASALGRCHTIDLRGLSVTDFSALGNCHTFEIGYPVRSPLLRDRLRSRHSLS